MATRLRLMVLGIVCALAAGASVAQVERATDAASSAPTAEGLVETRAVVRSIEESGSRLYIRLKLVPRAKLPFTTITYRVLDRRLVANLREGESVAFRAQRIAGENVVTALRTMPPCERLRPCQ